MHFKNTNNREDKLHTETIFTILNEKGFNIAINKISTLFNQLGIGKYNTKTSIDSIRKSGFDFIKYIE